MKKSGAPYRVDSGERLRDRLSKTRRRFAERLNTLVTRKKAIDPSLLEGIEEILLTSDIGLEITEQLIQALRQRIDQESIDQPEQLKAILKDEMISCLEPSQDLLPPGLPGKSPGMLQAIMFVGVNGVGKTSTIAKMAHYFQARGERAMLVAADTFRAAAIEQATPTSP